jgi:hypothetical protein
MDSKTLIFMDTHSILKWKMDGARSVANTSIFAQPKPWAKEPYYYRNLRIKKGRLAIIQNSENRDFPSALAISKKWITSSVNPGYTPDLNLIKIDSAPLFRVYTEKGKTHESKKGKNIITIFGYDDGSYAGLLFV